MSDIQYRDRLGRQMVIVDVTCLCGHQPHHDRECPACGCLYYRTTEPNDRMTEPPDAPA